MNAGVSVKICGLKSEADVKSAAAAGANYIGLNFFPPSPRFVELEVARHLALAAPVGMAKVGLVVDADDATIDALLAVVPIDMLQLHGHESVARVADIKSRFGLPVMKVVGISGPHDLAAIERYGAVADQLMVDAKPPKDAVLPGGNGTAFDWTLLAGQRWPRPWMLAGGLTPENVTEAIHQTKARQVDVASGVEIAPGQKDAALMAAFCAAARL